MQSQSQSQQICSEDAATIAVAFEQLATAYDIDDFDALYRAVERLVGAVDNSTADDVLFLRSLKNAFNSDFNSDLNVQ